MSSSAGRWNQLRRRRFHRSCAAEGNDLRQRAVVANVRFNVQRLQEATPILADMVKAGKLRVVGAVYDLPTGKVALV